jgi:hypothetical protein
VLGLDLFVSESSLLTCRQLNSSSALGRRRHREVAENMVFQMRRRTKSAAVRTPFEVEGRSRAQNDRGNVSFPTISIPGLGATRGTDGVRICEEEIEFLALPRPFRAPVRHHDRRYVSGSCGSSR